MKQLCIYFVLSVALSLLLSACRTTSSAESNLATTVHDTIRVHTMHTDSVYLHDSITIAVQGDTIYKTKYQTLHHYSIQYRDSIVTQRDTIPVTVTVEKQVKYIPTYMRCFAGIGLLFTILSIMFILYKIKK